MDKKVYEFIIRNGDDFLNICILAYGIENALQILRENYSKEYLIEKEPIVISKYCDKIYE